MPDVFVIIDQEAIQGFTHPGLDLLTGQVIELDPAARVLPPYGPFSGVDPAHLDAVSQEYRTALEDLTEVLVQLAHGLAKDRGQEGNK